MSSILQTLLRKIVFLLCLLLMVILNSATGFAQEGSVAEVTDEAPVEEVVETATDLPTDAPTDIPTETPTEVVPAEPTAQDTPTLTPSETLVEVTSEVTATLLPVPSATSLPAEPPLSPYYGENFDDSDLSDWNVGTGWTLLVHEGAKGARDRVE